jgi:2,4-dienoyl-CoA reductase-like NADH-dependent reductase (Old Yellow Enzyme family)
MPGTRPGMTIELERNNFYRQGEFSRKYRDAMSRNPLFSPLQAGPYLLQHRVVMAPLTRMRAERSNFAPRTLNAEYYGQRATAGGLIIAEASPVAATGRGNPATPGIYSDDQVEGWRKVVAAVHAEGGFIFLQLWHVGRCRIPRCSRSACCRSHHQRCRSPERECWR